MSGGTVVIDFLLEAGYPLERAKVAVKALKARSIYAVALTHEEDNVPVPQKSFYSYREADAYAKELKAELADAQKKYTEDFNRLCNTKMSERKFQKEFSELALRHVVKFRRTEAWPSSFSAYQVDILEFPAP